MNKIKYLTDILEELGFDFDKQKEQYVFSKEISHFVLTIYKMNNGGYFCLKITDTFDRSMILSKRFHFIACSDEQFTQWVLDVKSFVNLFETLFCKTN